MKSKIALDHLLHNVEKVLIFDEEIVSSRSHGINFVNHHRHHRRHLTLFNSNLLGIQSYVGKHLTPRGDSDFEGVGGI